MKKILFFLLLFSSASAYEYKYFGVFYNNGVLTAPDSVRVFSRFYPSGDTSSVKLTGYQVIDTAHDISKVDRSANRVWTVWFGSTSIKAIDQVILPYDSIWFSSSYWAKLANVSDSGNIGTDTLAIRTMMRNNKFARLSHDTVILMDGAYAVVKVGVMDNNVITANAIQDSAFDGSAFKGNTFDSIHYAATFWIKLAKRSDSGAVAPTDTSIIKTMLNNNLFAKTDQAGPIDIDGVGRVQANVVSMDANTVTASAIANGAIDSATFTGDYWRHLADRADSGNTSGTDTALMKIMLMNNRYARTNLANEININADGYAQVHTVVNNDKTDYSLSTSANNTILSTIQADGTLISMIAYYWGAVDSSYQIHYPIGTYPKDSVCVFTKTGVKKMTVIYRHPTSNQVLDTVKVLRR